MPLFPLTPVGVEDKRHELYAMSNHDLFAQANAIKADFELWVINSFSLTASQDAFLRSMSNEAKEYYGDQCYICFHNRLPITLIYPLPPAPGVVKWTEVTNNIVVKANGTGTIEVTGSLTFTMEYRP